MPARRVIFNSINIGRNDIFLDGNRYKQMAGIYPVVLSTATTVDHGLQTIFVVVIVGENAHTIFINNKNIVCCSAYLTLRVRVLT